MKKKKSLSGRIEHTTILYSKEGRKSSANSREGNTPVVRVGIELIEAWLQKGYAKNWVKNEVPDYGIRSPRRKGK